MPPLVWLSLVSFGLALILTPIFRDVFHSYGVVDEPDQERKLHKDPIPRVGGMAIACSYVACFFLVPSGTRELISQQLSLVWRLLPAAGLIFAVGVVDDLLGLKPWQKLAGQIAAAGLAYWSGVRIENLAGFSTQDWWSAPVTLLWLLVCTNAFNLVDGMDGLAAGAGMFATLTIFVAALLHDNMPLALATLPLAGCLLGFLCYNFNPATIFLGDSGSLTLGFLLGCYGIIWTQKSATLLGMTAPLMALSIPLLDVCLAILRRGLRRQPIFGADRGHIHHRLLDRGLTPRRAVVILYGLCGLTAIFSLSQSVVRSNHLSGLILVLFCGVSWVGIQYLGYAEFRVAGSLLFKGDFQRTLNARLDLQSFEKAIADSRNLDDCWKTIQNGCGTFGFRCVRMQAAGQIYHTPQTMAQNIAKSLIQPPSQAGPHESWELRIPLSATDYIDFTRSFQSGVLATMAGPFVDTLHGALASKIREIEARDRAQSHSSILPESGLANPSRAS
ncbi:MAG: MraY family glycosyltransferase [Bryobacteraceae bacterium]